MSAVSLGVTPMATLGVVLVGAGTDVLVGAGVGVPAGVAPAGPATPPLLEAEEPALDDVPLVRVNFAMGLLRIGSASSEADALACLPDALAWQVMDGAAATLA